MNGRNRICVRVESLEPRTLFSVTVESIDGTGNNLQHTALGSAGTDLLRTAPATYADGISSPTGSNRPSARAVSNALNSQTTDAINTRYMSDMVYVFGQFLDHDLSLTTTGATAFNIPVPTGDTSFDPNSTGTKVISLKRSKSDATTGITTPAQQINDITSYIDGSQVYGSDSIRAAALRTMSGGKMKTSSGNMLPYNTLGLANANDAHVVADNQLFLAGDVRANENIELTSLQVLFVREHNRLADQIAKQHPTWTDEQIYQEARKTVIAELQSITFNEFLPALLGKQNIAPYRGYDPKANPSIANEFSAAAFRFGHSMLDGEIGRLNDDGTETPQGSVELRNAFFNPTLFDTTLPNHQGDIDPILKSAISGNAQDIDLKVVDDVRNFLFGAPGQGGLDLASLNIQRGRDHGLADYNSVRAAYGLPRVKTFAQISADVTVQNQLQATYGSVDNIDLWVGGLAEDHTPGSSMGATFGRIISDQFNRLRAGDRFWFEKTFSGQQLKTIENTKLSDIITRNTSLTTVKGNVFYYGQPANPVNNPSPKPNSPPPIAPPPLGAPKKAPTNSKTTPTKTPVAKPPMKSTAPPVPTTTPPARPAPPTGAPIGVPLNNNPPPTSGAKTMLGASSKNLLK